MTEKIQLGVLCSGRGSNFERIVKAARSREIPSAEVVLCLADRPAPVQELSETLGVECLLVEPKNYPDQLAWTRAMVLELKKRNVELIVLAGFLRKIEKPLLEAYPQRILNIHPALLPSFGGPGMYGLKVHEAVLASGAKESGVTIHVVDEVYDHGPVILQEKVPVLEGDTPETLQGRVLELEHRLYPRAIAKMLKSIEQIS